MKLPFPHALRSIESMVRAPYFYKLLGARWVMRLIMTPNNLFWYPLKAVLTWELEVGI